MLEEGFNHGEAVLWWCFAIGSFSCAFVKEKRWRRSFLGLAASFSGFGLSDWIEADTGAWWEPWWLLVLKGVSLFCIVAFVRVVGPALRPHRPKPKDE